MSDFIEHTLNMKEDIDPSTVILYTDSKDFMEDLSERIRDIPLIIFTQHPALSSFLGRDNIRIRKTKNKPSVGLDVLEQGKQIVLSCAAEGTLDRDERVMVVISTDIDTILTFSMEDIGVINLKEEIEDRLDLEILEAAFNIGTTIVREGKEGLPVGGLMILGDVNQVLKRTNESVRNPFKGCSKEDLNILDEEKQNTIIEYSMLDGALVVDRYGNPRAAGRYVMFKDDVDLNGLVEEGLGGRHLAASYITHQTRAIAIVASSEGAIRIYKDGHNIYTVEGI